MPPEREGKEIEMDRRAAEALSTLRGEISDRTGFENGETFASADEVRAYFTAEAQAEMFGEDASLTQAELDRMAAAVIENRWHCEF